MRTLAWLAIAWLAMTLISALSLKLSVASIMPNAAVVVVVFAALRREAIPLTLLALGAGYLLSRQAGAPTGLFEFSMVVTAISIYGLSGQLTGDGSLFFAMACGAGNIIFNVVCFGLLYLARGNAAFSSWATASLVFDALATAALGLIAFAAMKKLDAKFEPDQGGGLAWG